MYLVEYNLESDNSIDPCERFCLPRYLGDNIHLSIFSVNKKNNCIVTKTSIIYSQKNPIVKIVILLNLFFRLNLYRHYFDRLSLARLTSL